MLSDADIQQLTSDAKYLRLNPHKIPSMPHFPAAFGQLLEEYRGLRELAAATSAPVADPVKAEKEAIARELSGADDSPPSGRVVAAPAGPAETMHGKAPRRG